MQAPLDLLALLGDGAFHSGEALGRRLGISRAGVWKRVRALRAAGLVVHAVRGRGYRLDAPVEWLDAEAIEAAVPAAARRWLGGLEIHPVLDSTNAHLLERCGQGAANGTVCLAEMQRAGRGRRGRRWMSPPARNLYLSVLWRFETGLAALATLSVRLGLALAACLESQGVPGVRVKWPNDLVLGQRKAGGILVELRGEPCGPNCVVAGVGLNLGMPAGVDIDQPWTDLARAAVRPLSRNRLAGRVIGTLLACFAALQEDDAHPWYRDWPRYDALAGRRVRVHWPGRSLEGTALGIDPTGALRLRLVDGRVRRIASGEVSIRTTA
ncbi:MAG: biotin--[acetyl-CoA-carboxylase] ligase [Gammaproteobacteria bacterium]|nr:MAG: biotin--[acetyl-CoA-carboxylase] ligase [Gammaproteobacteria bacterium]